MTNSVQNQYEIPAYITPLGEFADTHGALLDCLHSQIESSKAFLRSNRFWNVAEVCRKILLGDDKAFNKLSRDIQVEINKLRRQGRELVGNAANIRPNFNILTSKSDEHSKNKANTYELLKTNWWYNRFANRTIKEVVQEAASGLGLLFIWPMKDPNTGEVEITIKSLSYKEGFPYQLPADGDIDKAYSYTVYCEIPYAQFIEEYPTFRNIVNPDRDAPTYLGKRFQKVMEATKGIRDIIMSRRNNKVDSVVNPSFPMVDVFYTFTRDLSTNESNKDVLMGTLINGDLAGHDSYRVKKGERLFPYGRRLTVWTHNHIIYDGAAKWLCDSVPVADFRFEKVPKEYIGNPVLNDGRSLEAATNTMINSILVRLRAGAEFPIAIDESLSATTKQRLQKGGLKSLIGKAIVMNLRNAVSPVKALFDYQLFQVKREEFEVIKSLQDIQEYLVGTNDQSNLNRLGQMPAADTQEAMAMAHGVLSEEHDREISYGIMKFAKIWLQFAPQVYTLKKRINDIGADGVLLKDIVDYDPSNLVPSGDPKLDKPYWLRLKEHIADFNLFGAPSSFQERQSTTRKLILLQVQKAGGTISDEKIYDAFIGDGKYKEEKEKWKEEQMEKAILATKIRIEVEKITQAGGIATSPEVQAMFRTMGILDQQATLGEGHPSDNNALPRMEIKKDQDGIQRSTNATYN